MNNTDEWQTPHDLFDKLNEEFHFDLDVACNRKNCLCKEGKYYEYCDSLNSTWEIINDDIEINKTPVCWMNPPYSRGNIEKFCKKAYEESQKGCTVVGLVRGDTSTKWFHKYCMKAHEIRFLTHRVKFVDPISGKQVRGSPNFGSIIVVWKPGNVDVPKISSYDW